MIFRKAMPVPFLLLACLAGCAVPAGNFAFRLDADKKEASTWSLKPLSDSGRLAFKFRLQQADYQTTTLAIRAAGSNKNNPILLIRFSDAGCTGNHTVMVQHKISIRESRIDYFSEKVTWGRDALLTIDWAPSGQARLQLNSGEVMNLVLTGGLGDLTLDAEAGIIEVKNLNYQKGSPDLSNNQ